MAVFPSGATRLWRMVTHAWAVISQSGRYQQWVSGSAMLLEAAEGWVIAALHWSWGSGLSHMSPLLDAPASPERTEPDRTRYGTAQLSNVLHYSNLSLTRSLLPPLSTPMLPLRLLSYFLPPLTPGFRGNTSHSALTPNPTQPSRLEEGTQPTVCPLERGVWGSGVSAGEK